MEEPKYIDIKEFRELGYLQELNRLFLHRLGFALSITIDDETEEEYINGIWDYREDKEGIYFDLANSDSKRYNEFRKKAQYVQDQFDEKSAARKEKLGFDVEPITAK